MICSNCGHSEEGEQNLCRKCGSLLDTEISTVHKRAYSTSLAMTDSVVFIVGAQKRLGHGLGRRIVQHSAKESALLQRKLMKTERGRSR